MLPDVVLPVRSRESYGSSLHIVRTGGHKHRCRSFGLLLCSQACKRNFSVYDSVLCVERFNVSL